MREEKIGEAIVLGSNCFSGREIMGEIVRDVLLARRVSKYSVALWGCFGS
jgi:hypothetical protein